MISTKRVAKVAAYHRRGIAFIAFVVCLVLEKNEFIGLVIGTIVSQIRHQ